MITKTRWVTFLWMRICGAGLLASAIILHGCATADLRRSPEVQSFEVPVAASVEGEEREVSLLRVMTLNLAHGRGQAFHQLLQNTNSTIQNLNEISVMLNREQPDVVALQEADGPSYWSGNFHHVDYLAKQGAFTNAVNGSYVQGMGLEYGTALLSNVGLRDAEAVTFNPDLALTPKGFVVSTIDWPGQPHVQVDVVSLHLDFSSKNTRRRQALELIELMRERNRPMIVMGDFNAGWNGSDSTVQLIAGELGLNAFNPTGGGTDTFTYSDKRLDWILVSNGLEFHNYQVVSDAVSDHRGVIAELRLNTRLVKNTYQ